MEEQTSTVETRSYQFSIRATIALTTAVAVWCWIFRELSFAELAVFSTVALAGGVAGHVLFTTWLPTRITVAVTALLLYNVSLVLLMMFESFGSVSLSECLELLGSVLTGPAEMAIDARGTRDGTLSIAILLATAIFTPAHTVWPSLPTALISAMGLGVWYAAGVLILVYAG